MKVPMETNRIIPVRNVQVSQALVDRVFLLFSELLEHEILSTVKLPSFKIPLIILAIDVRSQEEGRQTPTEIVLKGGFRDCNGYALPVKISKYPRANTKNCWILTILSRKWRL